jgi:hypothetical protein
MDFLKRFENFLLLEDKAADALGGDKPGHTLSGTFGRAYAKHKIWAVYLVVPVVNFFAYLIAGQKDHCQTVAANEAAEDGGPGE